LSAGGVTGSSSSSLPSTRIDDVHSTAALPTVDKSEVAKIKLAHLSDEQVAKIEKRVNQIGRSLGISFRSGGKIGSTRAAHHLIHLAQRENLSHEEGNDDDEEACNTALVSRLFEAYHELKMDISARDVLRKIAVDDARLNPVDVDECLDFCFDSSPSPNAAAAWSVATVSGDGVESVVDKEARENREQTSTGVPLFIVQGEYRVEGAQDLMEFVEIFGKIRGVVDVSGEDI
jgi:predicted DsbA family dithiol-disulfide isomerase